jgi:hypothetical protein
MGERELRVLELVGFWGRIALGARLREENQNAKPTGSKLHTSNFQQHKRPSSNTRNFPFLSLSNTLNFAAHLRV